jgi:hypothetical protein
MITGTKEYLDQIVKTHRCPEHLDMTLSVAWHKDGYYVIRCGADHYPEEVTRQPSLTQLWRQDKLPDGPIADNIKKREVRKMTQQTETLKGRLVEKIPAFDLGTGERLSGEAIYELTQYATKYGLDVFRSHVVVMYGKPYITTDGYLYHAAKRREPFSLDSRPMTTEELKQYKIGETDHGWLAWVRFPGKGTSFNGTGIVTYEEMTAKSPRDNTKLRAPVVAAHPWQLAQKRAEWQALSRAFPIGITEEEE